MAQVEQQSTQGKQDFLAAAALWADTLSKAVAGIAVAVYVCGFLIVSLHQSRFGFVRTNPFRPRILATGTWFFFFVVISVLIASRYQTASWMKVVRESLFVWVACVILGGFLGFLMFDLTAPDTVPRFWLFLAFVGASTLAVISFMHRRSPEWLRALASVLLTALCATGQLIKIRSHEFAYTSLALWFFICVTMGIMQFKLRFDMKFFGIQELAKALVFLHAALFTFAVGVYPHLKASWGGGTATNVTVYFGKDSPLYPNKSLQAQLVEESDEGLYIVGPKESRAIFVPRSAVAMI